MSIILLAKRGKNLFHWQMDHGDAYYGEDEEEEVYTIRVRPPMDQVGFIPCLLQGKKKGEGWIYDSAEGLQIHYQYQYFGTIYIIAPLSVHSIEKLNIIVRYVSSILHLLENSVKHLDPFNNYFLWENIFLIAARPQLGCVRVIRRPWRGAPRLLARIRYHLEALSCQLWFASSWHTRAFTREQFAVYFHRIR